MKHNRVDYDIIRKHLSQGLSLGQTVKRTGLSQSTASLARAKVRRAMQEVFNSPLVKKQAD